MIANSSAKAGSNAASPSWLMPMRGEPMEVPMAHLVVLFVFCNLIGSHVRNPCSDYFDSIHPFFG